MAIRAYDVTTSLHGKIVPDFENLSLVGMAIKLALHIRGIPSVGYENARLVANYHLQIPSTSFKAVLDILAEIEFVKVVSEGKTIKAIIPRVPYYDTLFDGMGEYIDDVQVSEIEKVTLSIVGKLAQAPAKRAQLDDYADKPLLQRALEIGSRGGYFTSRRARGQDLVITPLYYGENLDGLADLVAKAGHEDVKRVFALLTRYQGWPLESIVSQSLIGGHDLSQVEVSIVRALSAEGFTPPPAISTAHSGTTHYLFAPVPGLAKLPPSKRHLLESAMALVAAVRQGQHLPKAFRIKYPRALLQALRDNKFLKENSEAPDQYRALCTMRVGQLEHMGGDRYRFRLIERAENLEALDLAIQMLSPDSGTPLIDKQATEALRMGNDYLDSIYARQLITEPENIDSAQEAKEKVDDLLLGIRRS